MIEIDYVLKKPSNTSTNSNPSRTLLDTSPSSKWAHNSSNRGHSVPSQFRRRLSDRTFSLVFAQPYRISTKPPDYFRVLVPATKHELNLELATECTEPKPRYAAIRLPVRREILLRHGR